MSRFCLGRAGEGVFGRLGYGWLGSEADGLDPGRPVLCGVGVRTKRSGPGDGLLGARLSACGKMIVAALPGAQRTSWMQRQWRTTTSHHSIAQYSLRAYPGWAAASSALRAFLKAIRPQASWRRARWFSSFLHQRIRIPRFRFSQEWVASTTQRRARQPVVRALSLISSPRARMCGV